MIEGNGFVEGNRVIISAQLLSTVEEIKISEGQSVKQGQLLVRLNARQLEAKVDQAKAQLEIARNQVEQAEAALLVQTSQKEQATLAVDLVDRQYSGQLAQAEAASSHCQEQVQAALEQGSR